MTEEEQKMLAEILEQLHHTLVNISRSMEQVEARLKHLESMMGDGK